jgi:hypothetical protein
LVTLGKRLNVFSGGAPLARRCDTVFINPSLVPPLTSFVD